MNPAVALAVFAAAATAAVGCGRQTAPAGPADSGASYYGTLEPWASESIYFVMTDRFVDGDPSNNQVDQGMPDRGTFDRPIVDLEGRNGNIGYLGGDFRGVLDNAGYIADMGFSAIWITPIHENPDEVFMGGQSLGEGFFADRGKTGYHGYWGVNFYTEDEHLVSDGLDFAALTQRLREEHGLRTVLDIVCNHGSPSYSMPEDQPMFGEIYDADGDLVADHQNLAPEDLDKANPLHAFFHTEGDLAQLSNIDETNPAVLDYFAGAYLQWIERGAAAFRVDTIKHMPHTFWKRFSDRIRAEHPGFFMFGESFEFDAARVAQHTWSENGNISVLDFPGQKRITEVFADGAGYRALLDYLHLEDRLYHNPYELMTFYDNHDMPRMNADQNGFIDAHNWLFTSRGIPVVYYGSEAMFRAGLPEHGGNRDYLGPDNIEAARTHAVHGRLRRIARIRAASSALQRGLQVNLDFDDDTAAFYRVFQHEGVNQTALVLLNKADSTQDFEIGRYLSHGRWRDADSGRQVQVQADDPLLRLSVPPHDVRVLLFDAPVNEAALSVELGRLQGNAERNPT